MTRRHYAIAAAAASAACNAGVCLWGMTIVPEKAFFLGFMALMVPGLWGFVEARQCRGSDSERADSIMNWHRIVFAFVGLLISLRLAPQLAIKGGWLDASWTPAVQRMSGVVMGAGLAAWGNYLPKLMSPWMPEHEPFDWQRVHRFGGWVAFITGGLLIYVSLAFPPADARPIRVALTLMFLVLVVGRKFLSVATRSRDTSPG
jgi:hypothetical protein